MERVWLWTLALGVTVPLVWWVANAQPPRPTFREAADLEAQRLVNARLGPRTTESNTFEVVTSLVVPGPDAQPAGGRSLTHIKVTASVTGGIGFVRLITRHGAGRTPTSVPPTSVPAETETRETRETDETDVTDVTDATDATEHPAPTTIDDLRSKRIVLAEFEFRPALSDASRQEELDQVELQVGKTLIQPLINLLPIAVLADVEMRISNPRYEITMYDVALVSL